MTSPKISQKLAMTSVKIMKLMKVSPTSLTFPVIDVVIGELTTVHRF